MNTETYNTEADFDPSDPALHLEYLYGPQWREVARIVERVAQLTPGEVAQLNVRADEELPTEALANEGLTRLLSGLRHSPADTRTAVIAAATAKEFGRTRSVQVAGMVAGQAITATASADADGLGGLLAALGSVGALSTINRAITAAVLGDLVGRGEFTRDVYDELMNPWTTAVG